MKDDHDIVDGARGAASAREVLDEPSLEEVARVLWAGRKLLGILALLGAATAGTLAFIIPSTYEGVTTVIPVPREASRISFQPSVASEDLAALVGGGVPQRTMMLYPDLIKSRTLLGGVLLMRFPRASKRDSVTLVDLVQPRGRGAVRLEQALRRLRRLVGASVDRRTGLLTIRVRASDPAVAAGLANVLVERLQEFSIRSMASNAAENRRFIKGRLAETHTALSRAEVALEVFREGNLRIGNSPHLQLVLGRHQRAVRTQEEIFLVLTREYELARVAEHRDVPVINTLDTAEVPATRSWPRRGLLIAIGCLFGVGSGGVILVARERLFQQ